MPGPKLVSAARGGITSSLALGHDTPPGATKARIKLGRRGGFDVPILPGNCGDILRCGLEQCPEVVGFGALALDAEHLVLQLGGRECGQNVDDESLWIRRLVA